MIDMVRVHSSSIAKVGYTPHYTDGAPAVFVVFKSSPKRTYVYGVTRKRAFHNLMDAESIGRYFNKYIQPQYPLLDIL
jgi:hypothetical protein